MIKNFEHLLEVAQRRGDKKRLLVVSPHDAHTLEGVGKAIESDIVEPVFLGRQDRIREVMAEEGMDLSRAEVIPCSDDQEAAERAVVMIHRGEGDLLMKGSIRTSQLLRAVVHKKNGLQKGCIMSHVGVFQIPTYHKLVAITDGGMIPHPTLEEKGHLIRNAVSLMNGLGYMNPKIACLAAGEDVNPKAPETKDGAALKEMNLRGKIKDCMVEGPISYDLAMSKEAVEWKGYHSPVAGEADILLVPDMASGNILAKSWTISGGGIMAGMVVGAKVPIVLVSRGATTSEKFLSIALATCACQ